MGRRSSTGLLAERQSDTIAVRQTRLAKKGSLADVRIPCRDENRSDDEDQDDERD